MTTSGSSLELPSLACARRPEVSHVGRESAGRALTLFVQRRHHRHAGDAYRPEAVDRAAIFVPAAKQAAAA